MRLKAGQIPFALVLLRAKEARLTARLVFSSPVEEGVIMVDVLEGRVVHVAGTWGSGPEEMERLLRWKTGKVWIRPFPQHVVDQAMLASEVDLDPEFAASRESLSEPFARYPELSLLVASLKTLKELLVLGIFEQEPPELAWEFVPDHALGFSWDAMLPVFHWMREHHVRFWWTHTEKISLVVTQQLLFPGNVAIVGSRKMNVPYVRQIFRTLGKP